MSTKVFFCLAIMSFTIIYFYQLRLLHTSNIIQRKQRTKYMIEVDSKVRCSLAFCSFYRENFILIPWFILMKIYFTRIKLWSNVNIFIHKDCIDQMSDVVMKGRLNLSAMRAFWIWGWGHCLMLWLFCQFCSCTHVSLLLGLCIVNFSLWWLTPVIPGLGRLKQEDCRDFEPSLDYILNSRRTKDSVLKSKAKQPKDYLYSRLIILWVFKERSDW